MGAGVTHRYPDVASVGLRPALYGIHPPTSAAEERGSPRLGVPGEGGHLLFTAVHSADTPTTSGTAAAGHPLAWLARNEAERVAAGLRRTVRPRLPAPDVIDLAGNDYLGLARDERVVGGAVEALRTWGSGATGSRLVTGTTALHQCLEDELAAFCGAESALVFSSGYTANLGAVTALAGRGTLVVSDARNHASLVDACRLSRARVEIVPRGDLAAVDAALAARTEERAVVVTESVDSIDGEVVPLRALHASCRARGALLIVDEAHGLGVVGPGGRGFVAAEGLAGADDVVVTVTLSKALGSQGGAVLGPEAVRAHLIDTARTFIFDTGLNPAAVGGSLAALRILAAEPERAAAVTRVSAELAAAAGVPASPSAVVPVVLGSPTVAVEAAARCLERGVQVGCFRPPSVPEGTSRLRLTARADLTDADLDRIRTVFGEVLHGTGAAEFRPPAGGGPRSPGDAEGEHSGRPALDRWVSGRGRAAR